MTKPHKPHLSLWKKPMLFAKELLVFHISQPDFLISILRLKKISFLEKFLWGFWWR